MPRFILSAALFLIPLLFCTCSDFNIYVEDNFSLTFEDGFSVSALTQSETEYERIPRGEDGKYAIGEKEIDLNDFFDLTINKPNEFLEGEIAVNQPCNGIPGLINLAPADKESVPAVPLAGYLDSRRRFAVSLEGVAMKNVSCNCLAGSEISGYFLPEESDPQKINEGSVTIIYEGNCVSSELPSGVLLKLSTGFSAKRAGDFKPFTDFEPLCNAAR